MISFISSARSFWQLQPFSAVPVHARFTGRGRPPPERQPIGRRIGSGRRKTSASKISSAAPGKGGIVQTPNTALHMARCTTTTEVPHQRRAQPCAAEWRSNGGPRARRRTRRCTMACESAHQRLPTSVAKTPKQCGPPRTNSGSRPACGGYGNSILGWRTVYRAATAMDKPNQGGITAESLTVRGCTMKDEVEAPSVIRWKARSGGVGQPRLWHHPGLRPSRLAHALDLGPLERACVSM